MNSLHGKLVGIFAITYIFDIFTGNAFQSVNSVLRELPAVELASLPLLHKVPDDASPFLLSANLFWIFSVPRGLTKEISV